MKNKIYIGIMIVTTLFTACGNHDELTQLVLKEAGDNRAELQKVLDYFPPHSPQAKAAQFLVTNMYLHHSYEGWEIDTLRSIRKNKKWRQPIADSILNRWRAFDYRRCKLVRDIHVARAEVLIDNINLAFEAWKKRAWNQNYSFEEFCEYVLPYRVGDEPFENWRRIYYERYSPILDSLYQGDNAVEAAFRMAEYLKKEQHFDSYKDLNLPHLGALFLLNTRGGYCREECDICAYAMRAVGIPVTIDFYEISPSYNSRHLWNAVVDTNGLAVPFNLSDKVFSRNGKTGKRKKGKVYRTCYGIQAEKQKGLYADKKAYGFFKNPCLKDVSGEYFPDSHVNISVKEESDNDWLYLCVYSGQNYIPIDVTRPKQGVANFKYVEPGMIYFLSRYDNGDFTVCDYPFLATKEGPHFFIPDTQHRSRVALRRKYPLVNNDQYLAYSVGVTVSGANRKDFKDAELLYQVIDTPQTNYNIVVPAIKGKYRYIRYCSPEHKYIKLGEWYMYTDSTGQPIDNYTVSSNQEWTAYQREQLKLLTDGDWSTSYHSASANEQLTFDLGKPTPIDHFLFMPRNDDNFIHLGDTYELYYYDKHRKWKSLGRQTAKEMTIYYDNVPEGALLILRNHTRGRQERCFYMKNGEQIFP